MFEATFVNRLESLLAVGVADRRKQFPFELTEIDSSAIKHKIFRSSAHLEQIQGAYERELENRISLAWQRLVRVHRSCGSAGSDSLANDLKNLLKEQLDLIYAELSGSLLQRIAQIEQKVSLTLEDAFVHALAKHYVEIDLYVDSLIASKSGAPGAFTSQNYNFHGNVGSVQTGSNSTANVVQNLGATELASLSSALEQTVQAIQDMSRPGEQQWAELLEIAVACRTEMNSSTPNNTRVRDMFHVLGTSIQSIASAQPAYQALKLALLPLGIILP